MSQNLPPTPEREASQPTLGELVARISENVSGLIKGEIDLAKAKGKRMAVKMGTGIALLAVAGVLALYALGLLFDAAAHGIAVALPLWAGYLIVAVAILIVVAVLALVGVKRLQAGTKDVPAPQEGLREDLETAKTAVQAGLKKGDAQ
ncbi:phage holin family protein [Actinomyces faecalis]|uniref:phage holin family protein n=1 Tax=Actinomyces faecalis TaxID=2722820 RepID=UPI0015533F61|nr:phage holin family protein [Actinomyces faecalis]